MNVYAVLSTFGGVPTTIEAFDNAASARQRGRQLAAEYGLLFRPVDWEAEDGRWSPARGSQRVWEHHWYSGEHDVVVTQCDIQT